MKTPAFLEPLLRKTLGECVLVDAKRGSVLASRVESAFDSQTRKKGLLGRETIVADYALIIAPSNAVHTWFMRAPIDVVFVSRDGTVTKTRRGVKPWRIIGSLRAFAVIEAAEGLIDRHGLQPGDVVAVREVHRVESSEKGGRSPLDKSCRPT
jgi:hypothetical protein